MYTSYLCIYLSSKKYVYIWSFLQCIFVYIYINIYPNIAFHLFWLSKSGRIADSACVFLFNYWLIGGLGPGGLDSCDPYERDCYGRGTPIRIPNHQTTQTTNLPLVDMMFYYIQREPLPVINEEITPISSWSLLLLPSVGLLLLSGGGIEITVPSGRGEAFFWARGGEKVVEANTPYITSTQVNMDFIGH